MLILYISRTYNKYGSVCRKTLLGSKDEVLWRVEGTQYPRNIAPPPLGEGLGLLPTGWGDVTKCQRGRQR